MVRSARPKSKESLPSVILPHVPDFLHQQLEDKILVHLCLAVVVAPSERACCGRLLANPGVHRLPWAGGGPNRDAGGVGAVADPAVCELGGTTIPRFSVPPGGEVRVCPKKLVCPRFPEVLRCLLRLPLARSARVLQLLVRPSVRLLLALEVRGCIVPSAASVLRLVVLRLVVILVAVDSLLPTCVVGRSPLFWRGIQGNSKPDAARRGVGVWRLVCVRGYSWTCVSDMPCK